MSKVKIQGHASGTGVLTVTAPNTSTDRTITLPDGTGTLLTTDGDGSSLTGVGVDGISSSADATAITIDSDENVGIGVTPTIGKLVVQQDTAFATTYNGDVDNILLARDATAGDGNYGGSISFSHIGTGNHGERMAAIAGVQTGSDANEMGLSFFTHPSGTGGDPIVEQLQITSDGRGLSQFTAKAWVNWEGATASAINDSHNVSSVTDNGTGKYTVNFANNMNNANYAVAGFVEDGAGFNDIRGMARETGGTQVRSTSAFGLWVNDGAPAPNDATWANLIVFGD